MGQSTRLLRPAFYRAIPALCFWHRAAWSRARRRHLKKAFVDFCAAVHLAYRRIDHIYCDSAEQVLIRGMQIALQRSALSFAASRVSNAAKTEINDRIRLVSVLMGAGRFWYLPEAGSARRSGGSAVEHKGPDERRGGLMTAARTSIRWMRSNTASSETISAFLKARGHT